MMIMPANHSSPTIHYLSGKYPGRFGWLIGPSARSKTKLRHWMPYALDNDAFSAWSKKQEWNEGEWVEMLKWARRMASGAVSTMLKGHIPLWVLIPDSVGNRDETLEKWDKYFPIAADFGWPLAFAVQDGMSAKDVPEAADVVFVGGTDSWKFPNLTTWTQNFERVHVGRVNGIQRVRECQGLGVESIDGTGWFRDTEEGRRIKDLTEWLEDKPQVKLRQETLF